MDSSIYFDGALLWSPLTKASSFAARSLDRTNSQWEDHELGGLLRRTNFPPHSPGFVFHRMGRTVKRSWVSVGVIGPNPPQQTYGSEEGNMPQRKLGSIKERCQHQSVVDPLEERLFRGRLVSGIRNRKN